MRWLVTLFVSNLHPALIGVPLSRVPLYSFPLFPVARCRGVYVLWATSIAVFTGMRRSELCGLKWDQVDLVRGNVRVVSTLQRIAGHGLVEGQPKTTRSRRSIALNPDAVEVLQSIKGEQIGRRLEAGPIWQDLGYVFTQADGLPVAPDMISKDFCALVRRHRLPQLTFHGLRHAFASLMLSSGVNLKVTSEMLGHSNIAITGDIYSHVLPGLQEEAVLALSRRLAQGH